MFGKKNGTFVPMAKGEDTFFKKITTEIEWIDVAEKQELDADFSDSDITNDDLILIVEHLKEMPHPVKLKVLGWKKCFCLQPCNTGKYGSYDHKDCQSCVAGRYSDKTGLVKSTDALPCAICPKGYWQDEAGFLWTSNLFKSFDNSSRSVV